MAISWGWILQMALWGGAGPAFGLLLIANTAREWASDKEFGLYTLCFTKVPGERWLMGIVAAQNDG
jgi:hypothetical protein